MNHWTFDMWLFVGFIFSMFLVAGVVALYVVRGQKRDMAEITRLHGPKEAK